MCTVTYIPNQHGWTLTSNRDENPERNSDHVVKRRFRDNYGCYPPDDMGGSWIAADSRGRCYCLLNGAFVKHQRSLPYKSSRGKILLAGIMAENVGTFLYTTDLNGIEPFTLVMVEQKHLVELRWDGMLKHIKTLSKNQNYIWSSCTLYDSETIKLRERAFGEEKFGDNTTGTKIIAFHKSRPFGEDAHDFLMQRPGVATISITQVSNNDGKVEMTYYNLLNDSTLYSKLDI